MVTTRKCFTHSTCSWSLTAVAAGFPSETLLVSGRGAPPESAASNLLDPACPRLLPHLSPLVQNTRIRHFPCQYNARLLSFYYVSILFLGDQPVPPCLHHPTTRVQQYSCNVSLLFESIEVIYNYSIPSSCDGAPVTSYIYDGCAVCRPPLPHG